MCVFVVESVKGIAFIVLAVVHESHVFIQCKIVIYFTLNKDIYDMRFIFILNLFSLYDCETSNTKEIFLELLGNMRLSNAAKPATIYPH